ncbi:MAG: hypothetical protein WCU00_11885 [Candidatus Latescibacterota bacterium]
MAAKLKKNPPKSQPAVKEEKERFTIKKPALWATGFYVLLACIFTFPLLFRMNSSVYGFYDHVSTDLFASLHYYFWWMKESLGALKSSPFFNPLFAAPFGQHMKFANFTGFVMAPFSLLFGYLFSHNLTILFNLVMSGLGMFLVVRHITKSAAAGMVAGIVFAFCPNMLVRSYTTFDSTQVQWIPFFTLFVLKFAENRTWKNALFAGLFLSFNILFAMPYYLVYLPVHTTFLLAVLAGWKIWGEKRGFGGFLKDITAPSALNAWVKTGVTFALVVIVFGVYYTKVIGGSGTVGQTQLQRSTTDLENLSLKPLDYFVPHPRSAFLKGNFKETYWDKVDRPEKNSDSDVAYIGYAAFLLALIGLFKSKGAARLFFFAGSAVAFWATMGPYPLGLPSPSAFIHTYAPFARRILLYKVYVQFGIAGLAGLGTVYILELLKTQRKGIVFLSILTLVMMFEYTLVPPALTVNLTVNPEVYERVKDLPATSKIIEVPERRVNGNLYQGYIYYQTIHGKALFNPYMDIFQLKDVPERIRPFYHQMEVPVEAGEYCNLAALRWLGITHLIYHFYIGTTTVQFASFQAGNLASGSVDGLKRIYQCDRDPRTGPYPGPFDYTFADLFEITADPCPVAVTFDYHSPFASSAVPGDFPTRFGYASALLDSSAAFYFPFEEKRAVNRIMRSKGLVTAVNLSDKPVEFAVSFLGSASESRTIEVQGENGRILGKFTLGPEPVLCMVTGFSLQGAGKSEIHIVSSGLPYNYPLDIGGGRLVNLPAQATLSDFRVTMKKK